MARAAAALLGAALTSLAACDGGGEREVREIKIENPHHEQLQALSEPMQKLGLMRAIRDSGKQCKRVESAAYQEDHQGLAMWVARCADERLWAIFIAPSGDIQVRNCDEAAQLGLPQCRPPGAAS